VTQSDARDERVERYRRRAARRAAKKTRWALAKTNVKAPSVLGFGARGVPRYAKSTVSLLYLF